MAVTPFPLPDVLNDKCPSRVLMNHVTSKWGVLVLLALSHGTMRYSDLKRRIQGVSERMLAQTLRTLEDDGFVVRKAYPEVPPRVEYTLTEFGRGAATHVAALATFLEGELLKQLPEEQQKLAQRG